MNQILLNPTDVLFFRDGRPMSGSLSGHGDAWPLPHVINNALHAALHRAGIENVHAHRQVVQKDRSIAGSRSRHFGSIVSAGPFPVRHQDDADHWFFPRPADAQHGGSVEVTLLPVNNHGSGSGSLPAPLRYAAGNCQPPTKDKPEPWLGSAAFASYLQNSPESLAAAEFAKNDDIHNTEHQIGIGISPETGTQDGESFYSARYLRMREEWRLGMMASGIDKGLQDNGGDLIATLLASHQRILVGGQQRICTASRAALPAADVCLPRGLTSGFAVGGDGRHRVKWVLLSPAIWPEIGGLSKDGRAMNSHPGGWLPNWIAPEDGRLLLRSVAPQERARRRNQRASGKGYAGDENSNPINARLVAAIVPKPLLVTGWSLGRVEENEEEKAGAKSAHHAVPAGAVYYFEAASAQDAEALAAALNWHGKGAMICNRRSTLMGEKGFGLGVCGTWTFFPHASKLR